MQSNFHSSVDARRCILDEVQYIAPHSPLLAFTDIVTYSQLKSARAKRLEILFVTYCCRVKSFEMLGCTMFVFVCPQGESEMFVAGVVWRATMSLQRLRVFGSERAESASAGCVVSRPAGRPACGPLASPLRCRGGLPRRSGRSGPAKTPHVLPRRHDRLGTLRRRSRLQHKTQ